MKRSTLARIEAAEAAVRRMDGGRVVRSEQFVAKLRKLRRPETEISAFFALSPDWPRPSSVRRMSVEEAERLEAKALELERLHLPDWIAKAQDGSAKGKLLKIAWKFGVDQLEVDGEVTDMKTGETRQESPQRKDATDGRKGSIEAERSHVHDAITASRSNRRARRVRYGGTC